MFAARGAGAPRVRREFGEGRESGESGSTLDPQVIARPTTLASPHGARDAALPMLRAHDGSHRRARMLLSGWGVGRAGHRLSKRKADRNRVRCDPREDLLQPWRDRKSVV